MKIATQHYFNITKREFIEEILNLNDSSEKVITVDGMSLGLLTDIIRNSKGHVDVVVDTEYMSGSHPKYSYKKEEKLFWGCY